MRARATRAIFMQVVPAFLRRIPARRAPPGRFQASVRACTRARCVSPTHFRRTWPRPRQRRVYRARRRILQRLLVMSIPKAPRAPITKANAQTPARLARQGATATAQRAAWPVQSQRGSSPCLDCPSTTIAAPDATRCLCDAGHGFLGVGEAPRVRYVVTREGLDYVLNGTYAPVIAIYDGVGLEFDYLGLTNNDNGYRTVVTGRGISSTYEDNMLLVEVQPNQFAENLRYRSASNFALRLGVKWQLKREDELVEGYTRLLEPDMRAALRSKQHFTMDELDNLGLLSSEIRSTNYVRVGNRYYVPETRMGNSITHKIASEWPSRPVPTCAQCAPGLFKPSAGNEACEGVRRGSF